MAEAYRGLTRANIEEWVMTTYRDQAPRGGARRGLCEGRRRGRIGRRNGDQRMIHKGTYGSSFRLRCYPCQWQPKTAHFGEIPLGRSGRPPDRDAGRDRDPERHGHHREYDAKHPRRDFSERVDGVVRDVAAFRVVALLDLIQHQFDGHPFAGRRGIGEAEQRGWIERQTPPGPKGGRFTVLVATPAGAARAAGLWATEGRASQRVFSGVVKTADMRHDVAVYRAACEAHARIEAAGGRVARIRIDAELKGQVAGQVERARQVRGRVEAVAERRWAAAGKADRERSDYLSPRAELSGRRGTSACCRSSAASPCPS